MIFIKYVVTYLMVRPNLRYSEYSQVTQEQAPEDHQ